MSPALPEVSPKLGWMVGDIEIDPFNSNRMLYGTGATIYGTDDLTNWDAGTPVTITVQAQGLEETAVQDLISPPQGAPLLSALGGHRGLPSRRPLRRARDDVHEPRHGHGHEPRLRGAPVRA